MAIPIRTKAEIAMIREAGRVVAKTLQAMVEAAKPGVSTGDLDAIAREWIKKEGVKSAFLDYAPGGRPPYPAVICASVNHEVVHGIPSHKRKLREGDIIGLDFGVVRDGWFADSAVTIGIGEVAPATRKLMDTARRALELGIDQARPGRRTYDIGAAIQDHAEAAGYEVVREFVGHGVGRRMHEEPQVPNYGPGDQGPRLRAGMVIAIEPMVNVGTWAVEELDDQWTAVTADGSLSAHYEHTVAITEDGPEILTLP